MMVLLLDKISVLRLGKNPDNHRDMRILEEKDMNREGGFCSPIVNKDLNFQNTTVRLLTTRLF